MKNMKSVLFILSLAFSLSVYSQNTGRITGKITDKEAKEAAIGVNVILEGTRFGAATDIDGNYAINNVPPGEYSIIVSAIGYQKVRINHITVKNNLTTKQDILISATTLELSDEVVVTADRPLVQKDLTSNSSIVTSEELKAMPVENIGQLINLQAGVVGGHFRGGRSNEVAYLVDGVSVTDPFNNTTSVGLENNTIRQTEIISGTFNAEYGNAMSGVVNTVTKSGGPKYEFNVSSSVGNYTSGDTKIFRNLDNPFKLHSFDIQGGFAGPIPFVKDLTFFTNARYFTDEGYFYGKRVYNISDAVPFIDPVSGNDFPKLRYNRLTQTLTGGTGDGNWVAMSPYEKKSFQGKLTYSQPNYNLNYLLIADKNQSQGYRHDMVYSPDGRKTNYWSNSVQSLKFTYIPDGNTFHDFTVSYKTSNAEGYLHSNPNDTTYVADRYGYWDALEFGGFRAGGNEVDRYDRYTNTLTGQWSITSQVNNKHKIGAGINASFYEIHSASTALQEVFIGTVLKPDSINTRDVYGLFYPALHSKGNLSYLEHPTEISAYIQDKMEYDMMIVNVGIRFDYFNANTTVPFSMTNPENIEGKEGYGKRKKIDPKFQISPRLGVSFPISDQGAIHFSYGHFFQMPSFDNLYYNSEYAFISTGTATATSDLIGNPDLKAQETAMYEVGLQQAVAENASLSFTIYYRDIRNLLATEVISKYDGVRYGRYTNKDFGNVKGLVLTFDKQFADWWSGKIDYTYQIAEGNSSDPNQTFNYISEYPPRPAEIKTVSLDWDQRTTFNATITVGKPGDWTISSIFSYGSGFPYTENNPDAPPTIRFLNGGVKPQTYNVDLRAEKGLDIYGYRVSTYLLIYNLFNFENETGVYASTGRANRDIQTERDILSGLKPKSITEDNINNPSLYSAPRNFKIGASLSF